MFEFSLLWRIILRFPVRKDIRGEFAVNLFILFSVHITLGSFRMFIFPCEWRRYVPNIPRDVRREFRVVGFQQDLPLSVYITFHIHCSKFVHWYYQ